MRRARLIQQFPGLGRGAFRCTSPIDYSYNCYAWAAHDTRKKWAPVPYNSYYWPERVPNQPSGWTEPTKPTLATYVSGYATLGFAPCADPVYVPGVEKIAIYMKQDGSVTHAARQLDNGLWTSKMGRFEDIEHELEGLEGEAWGQVSVILSRVLNAQVEIPL